MTQRKQQSGSQAVEFALVLPFMILIIFAVLDFAFLAYNKAVITNASREGARRASVLTTATWSTATVAQVACNYARNALIHVGTGTSTTTCSGTADPVISVTPASTPTFASPITVTVQYTSTGFSMGSWFNLGTGPSHIGSPITLTATTQMLHE
ncbi:MAG: TadE/TadG family type IV pilus assembly protein [Ramlibacter sp.]